MRNSIFIIDQLAQPVENSVHIFPSLFLEASIKRRHRFGKSFGVAENMFVETGLGFNAGFGTESEGDYKQKMQNMNFKVPVNYVYRFNVADGITIAPYAGINFKLNVATKLRDEYDGQKSDWVSVFDKDKMGSDDLTWNRFQMGWQVGVGFSYDKYYLGIQYGTDFIPAYSHKFDGGTPKVNSSNLNIAVGYTF